jgi:hypothetical protein
VQRVSSKISGKDPPSPKSAMDLGTNNFLFLRCAAGRRENSV